MVERSTPNAANDVSTCEARNRAASQTSRSPMPQAGHDHRGQPDPPTAAAHGSTKSNPVVARRLRTITFPAGAGHSARWRAALRALDSTTSTTRERPTRARTWLGRVYDTSSFGNFGRHAGQGRSRERVLYHDPSAVVTLIAPKIESAPNPGQDITTPCSRLGRHVVQSNQVSSQNHQGNKKAIYPSYGPEYRRATTYKLAKDETWPSRRIAGPGRVPADHLPYKDQHRNN